MTDDKAREVCEATFRHGPFAAIALTDARRILGDEMFDRMMADKLRNKGPTPDSVYPWNVTAYLMIAAQEPNE